MKKIIEPRELQLVTMAKIKRAESAGMNESTSYKFYSSLKVKCSELPASF
jgi:hypothetical protein